MDKESKRGEIIKFTVDRAGERLDRLVHEKIGMERFSRSRIKELILKGDVLVDGRICKKPSYRLRQDQEIVAHIPQEKGTLCPKRGELNIVWRDEFLAIIDKPPGLQVHPAPSYRGVTLVHYLLSSFPNLSTLGGERPGIVHRLDRDTSGLMVVALTLEAQQRLRSFFKERRVEKRYIALVWGRFSRNNGMITLPLGRDEGSRIKMGVRKDGREAITLYRVLRYFQREDISLIDIRILTGRTHQIRVHMSHVGHPVVGDRVYGGDVGTPAGKMSLPTSFVKRQMLHCWRLSFPHPIKGSSLRFVSPLPLDMFRVVLKLLSRPMVVGITGNVGSGKSTVSKILSRINRGVHWSADDVVARLYREGEPGWEMIRRTFGIEYVDEEKKEVDKTRLLVSMNREPGFREELMKIIHPLVEGELITFLSNHAHKRLVVCEVPLLFEAGWHRRRDIFDIIVMVYCDRKERYRRLKEIRGWSQSQIQAIDSWQLPQEYKVRLADIILDNSGDRTEIEKKVHSLAGILKRIRRKKLKKELVELFHIDKSGTGVYACSP